MVEGKGGKRRGVQEFSELGMGKDTKGSGMGGRRDNNRIETLKASVRTQRKFWAEPQFLACIGYAG